MKTFAIITLGCKVNSYESESYYLGLVKLGYVPTKSNDIADIYIINTCCVTNIASSKSRKMIHRCRKQNPQAFICVVGCFSQLADKEWLKHERVDLCLGSQYKNQLVDLIKTRQSINKIENLEQPTFEILPVDKFLQTRAYLKIQDGCNQYCSYCIIPFARGQERSMPIDLVLRQANEIAKSHQEIVLAGIHTGRYGMDISTNLTSLLKELIKIANLKRIRLSSIEISELSDELIALFKQSDKLAKHLHIPLQSGSDVILQAMNRPYTTQQFYHRLQEIRTIDKNISISTDIIVGYPGEDEHLWQNSTEFIRSCNFSFLHVFPFSKKDKTKAALADNQISSIIKKTRVQEMLNYSALQEFAFAKKFIRQEVVVLVEDGQKGYTSEYLITHLKNKRLKNQLVKIIVNSSKEGELFE